MTRRRRALAAGCILAAGLGAAACGSQDVNLRPNEKPNVQRGAVLFAQRCSGCHTFAVAGTQGGATKIHDRERTDGPNFNVRRESLDSVLYAVRNGGFSGAIMPENIVVGNDAADVAAFVSKYAGGERKGNDITPQSQPETGAGSSGGGAGAGAPTTGATTSTPAQTTSTPAQTTSTPAQTTSTPAQTTSTPAQTTPQASTQGGGTQQASAQGKQVFTQNCASCHTLKDAAAKGTVGPNLDDLKPDQATVQRQVTNGGGAMPAFKGVLQDAQIKAVAQYVSSVAGT